MDSPVDASTPQFRKVMCSSGQGENVEFAEILAVQLALNRGWVANET